MATNKFETINQLEAKINQLDTECEQLIQLEPSNPTVEEYEELNQETIQKMSDVDNVLSQWNAAFNELNMNQKLWTEFTQIHPSNKQETLKEVISRCQDALNQHMRDIKRKKHEISEGNSFGRMRHFSGGYGRTKPEMLFTANDTPCFKKTATNQEKKTIQYGPEDNDMKDDVHTEMHTKEELASDNILVEDRSPSAMSNNILNQSNQTSELFSAFNQVLRENQRVMGIMVQQMGNTNLNRNNSDDSQSRSYPRLRELPYPVFTGDKPQEFWIWREEFENCIGRRRDIDDAVKLHYLKEALRKPARHILDGLAMKGENYAYALQELENKYGDGTVVEAANLVRLKQIGASQCQHDSAAMFRVYHEQKSIIRSISDRSEPGLLHIELIRSAYPWSLMEKVVEKETEFKEQFKRPWMIMELLEAIRKAITVVEMKENSANNSKREEEPASYRINHFQDRGPQQRFGEQRNQFQPRQQQFQGHQNRGMGFNNQFNGNQYPKQYQHSQNERRFGQQNNFNMKPGFRPDQSNTRQRQRTCVGCNMPGHLLSSCNQFVTVEDKERCMAERGKCMKCFSPLHRTEECGRNNCKKCNGLHSIVLCHQAYKNGVYEPYYEPNGYRQNNQIRQNQDFRGAQRTSYGR